MPNRASKFVLYSTFILLLLFGTSLLFLEQIINTETLSATTIQISRTMGIAALFLAIMLWFLRHPFQAIITWFLKDVTQDWAQLRRNALKSIRQENHGHLAALASIIMVAIGLRLAFITQPIRTDEALTYLQFASKPLYIALSDYAAPNNHLLHTLLVHLSTRFLGNSEVAIRLPAFVFGILMIPAAYVAVRTLYNKNAALPAAGLCAVSSVLIEYSVNARGYTLQTTLFLLALVLAIYARQHARPAAWALLALLLAAGFYTVPTMLYAVASIMLWLLVSILTENSGQQRQKLFFYELASGILTGILTLILYLPVFIVSGISAIINNSYVQALEFSQFIEQTPPAVTALWQQWHTSIYPWVAVLLALGVFAAVLFHRRVGRQKIAFFWAMLLIIPILMIQRVHPFMRVWLFLLPIYFGMAAAGWFYILSIIQTIFLKRQNAKNPEKKDVFVNRIGYALTLMMVGMGALTIMQTQSPYHSIETGTFRDAENVALFLAEQQAAEKIIYEHPSGESLRYYFVRHHLPLTRLEWDYVPHDSVYVVVNTEYAQTIASVLLQNGLRMEDYEGTLLQEYPLANIFIAHSKIKD